MKKMLIALFKKLGFAVKFTNLNEVKKYKVNSDKNNLSLFNTPVGKYYLPSFIKDDQVANTIKKGLLFDEEIIEIAKEFIKKNTAVLDVGANYGQMSVVLSKYIGSIGNGKVYSFEAEPFVAEVLKNNVEINSCKNIEVVPGAVYYKTGEKVVFPEPDFKRFDAYGSYGIDPSATSGRTVDTISIDSMQILEPISFIKIDIQGSDLFALQGARETILKNKPVIIFEYEEQFQSEFKTNFNDYVEFVKSIDYKFIRTVMGINYLIAPNDYLN